MVSAMEGLDKSLVNVSFWSYGKHVARLWMAYTNIANDVYLHTKGNHYDNMWPVSGWLILT